MKSDNILCEDFRISTKQNKRPLFAKTFWDDLSWSPNHASWCNMISSWKFVGKYPWVVASTAHQWWHLIPSHAEIPKQGDLQRMLPSLSMIKHEIDGTTTLFVVTKGWHQTSFDSPAETNLHFPKSSFWPSAFPPELLQSWVETPTSQSSSTNQHHPIPLRHEKSQSHTRCCDPYSPRC